MRAREPAHAHHLMGVRAVPVGGHRVRVRAAVRVHADGHVNCRVHAAALIALAAALCPAHAVAQGHGPVFGLSTPTLPEGGWSLDMAAMGRAIGTTASAMLRPMVSYGINEDLQLSASFPMPLYARDGVMPGRMSARMPATPDEEFTLGWCFSRMAPGVGSRLEGTAYLAFEYPTDAVRAGMRTSPGLTGALAYGYASRPVYAWVGGLYRRYMSPVGGSADHIGDLAMATLVLGYRPAPFRRDLPHP